jgi:hypothetical protein
LEEEEEEEEEDDDDDDNNDDFKTQLLHRNVCIEYSEILYRTTAQHSFSTYILIRHKIHFSCPVRYSLPVSDFTLHKCVVNDR